MPYEHLLKKLIALGLTGYEAKVYLSMLGRNSLTASEISRLSGVPRQRTYDVLNSLHIKGLCVEVPGEVMKYHASEPEEALLGMLVDRNREFQRRLEEQREIAVSLAREIEFSKEKAEDPEDPSKAIQVFVHRDQMLRKYDEMLLGAEEEVLGMARLPYIQARAEKTYEKVKEGVRIRFLIDEEVLEKEPAMIEAIFRLYGDHEHRFIRDVPLKCYIFDRKAVLLTSRVDAYNGFVSILIKSRELASALVMLFESLWHTAVPAVEKWDDIQRVIAEVEE